MKNKEKCNFKYNQRIIRRSFFFIFFFIFIIVKSFNINTCKEIQNETDLINMTSKNFTIHNFSNTEETSRASQMINFNEDKIRASNSSENKNEIEFLGHKFIQENANMNKIQPDNKIINPKEETISAISIIADSTYTEKDADGNILLKLNAKNLLFEGIWCSAGNHGIKDEIKLLIEFEKTRLLNSLWIHWAYAPGEFRIRYSHNKIIWKDIFSNKFRILDKNTDARNFQKLIKDRSYLAKLKSFDEKIYLDEVDFARYIEIIMRIPINKYFGIQKLEFYQLNQIIVMLKSEIYGEELCMSVSDFKFKPYSNLIAQNCINAISYDDNREIFIINSNGYVTPYSQPNMCVQSNSNHITLIECSVAEEFRDERQSWILEPDGFIRSKKDSYKCLDIEQGIDNYGSRLSNEHMSVHASSSQADNRFGADNAIDYNSSGSYWASEPSANEVEFKIEFKNNLYYPIHLVQVKWKFPAKNFELIGLLSDNSSKIFSKVEGNRRTFTEHSIKGYQLKGFIIKMKESSMRIENKNIYGIMTIYVNIDGRFIYRGKCKELSGKSNKWKMIHASFYDRKSGIEYQKNMKSMYSKKEELKNLLKSYEKVPEKISEIRENEFTIENLFKKVDDIIAEFKSNLIPFSNLIEPNENPSNKYFRGENFYSPGTDCAEIKHIYPEKRSGYYWIKTECMEKPLRVFCGFDKKTKTAMDYYIVEIKEKDKQDDFKFNNKTPKEKGEIILTIRKKCAELGLEPLEIRNLDVLLRLVYLIKSHRLSYEDNNKYIFPLGINYGSDYFKRLKKSSNSNDSFNSSIYIEIDSNYDLQLLNGKFFSFNKEDSPNLMDLIKDFQISPNFNSDKFYILKEMMDSFINNDIIELNFNEDSSDNVIGVSSHDKIILSKIQHHKIIGFACSSNNPESYESNQKENLQNDKNGLNKDTNSTVIIRGKYKEIKCETSLVNLISQKNVGSPNNNNYVVLCPNDCAAKKFPVYGTKIYSDHSSICRAGLHTGLINDIYGGYFSVTVIDGKDFYEGTVANEVESKELNQRISNSFKLDKYEFDCANKNVEADIKAYINKEKTPDIKTVSKKLPASMNNFNRFMKSFLSLEDKILNNMGIGISSNKNLNSSQYLEIKNSNNKNFNLILPNSNNDISNNQTETNPSINIVNTFSQSQLDLFPSTKTLDSLQTENAIIQLHSLNEKIEKDIKQTDRIIEAFKILASKTQEQVLYYKTYPHRGVEIRVKNFARYLKQSEEIDKLITHLESIFSQRINKAEDELYDLKDIISSMMRWENFQEDYTYNNILTNYFIFNNKKTEAIQNPPANWEYYIYNINGRNKVIKQTNAFYDYKSGSHLVIKGREFYDFELKVSVFIPKENLDTFGVAFRYADHYNYYIFEISKRENGFKRIRKFINGEPQILNTKYDGGYNVDEWIDIKIRGINSNFKIYIKSHDFSLNSDYDIVFEFKDNSILHGTMAFASLMLNNIMLDDISVIQIPCTDFSAKNIIRDIKKIEKKSDK